MAYFYSPFRKDYKSPKNKRCTFCDPRVIARQIIHRGKQRAENESYVWIVNAYPKFEGHTLLVPKRHVERLEEQTPQEILDREALLIVASQTLQRAFPGSGLEVFLQTGAGSESTIAHLHTHVVAAAPTDPLRSFDKLGQFYTVVAGKERVVLFPHRIQHSPQQLRTLLGKKLTKQK